MASLPTDSSFKSLLFLNDARPTNSELQKSVELKNSKCEPYTVGIYWYGHSGHLLTGLNPLYQSYGKKTNKKWLTNYNLFYWVECIYKLKRHLHENFFIKNAIQYHLTYQQSPLTRPRDIAAPSGVWTNSGWSELQI